MALLRARINGSWVDLPTPAPENYEFQSEWREKSFRDSNQYLHRDMIRKIRKSSVPSPHHIVFPCPTLPCAPPALPSINNIFLYKHFVGMFVPSLHHFVIIFTEV